MISRAKPDPRVTNIVKRAISTHTDRSISLLSSNPVQTKITPSSERLSEGVFICSAPKAFGGIARNDAMLRLLMNE